MIRTGAPTPSRRGWYAYIAVLLAVAIGRLAERVAVDSGGPASRFGPLLAAALVGVGIACWIEGRSCLPAFAWRSVFVVIVLTQLTAVGYALFLLQAPMFAPAGLLFALALLLIPAAYAMFHCGFRGREPRQKDS